MIGAVGTSALVSPSKHLTPSDDNETIALSGSAVLFASAFGNGLNYAFGIFLARTLGAEVFGLFALALTIFNMVTLTAILGMDIGATKFVSHHLGEGQQQKAKVSLLAAAFIAFGSGFVAAIGLALLASPIARRYRLSNDEARNPVHSAQSPSRRALPPPATCPTRQAIAPERSWLQRPAGSSAAGPQPPPERAYSVQPASTR